jgi:serine/threonine-protein phosphatase 6 regulatory subunit 3
VTEEPTDSEDTKRSHKFPFLACEIFTCEVPAILTQVVEGRDLLDKLFSILKAPSIHPTLAGYFSKVFVSLLKTSEEAVLKELSDSHLVLDFVKHLYSRSIAYCLTQVIGLEDRPSLYYLPIQVEAVKHVVALVEASQSYETCSNAAYVLSDVISRSKEISGWSEIIKVVCRKEVLTTLLKQLASPEVYVVKAAVQVLSALCKPEIFGLYKGSEQDEDSTLMKDEDEVPALIELLIGEVDTLSQLLRRPGAASQVTTFGVSAPVLGEGRLKVMEFVNQILMINNPALVAAVARSDLLEVMTRLFSEFKWNSLLHVAYETLVLTVLRSNSIELKAELLGRAGLPRLLISLGETEAKYGNGVLMRAGSAGHVTRIANIIDSTAKTQDYTRGILDGTQTWHDFYSTTVKSINEVESRTLGGKEGNSSFRSVTSEEDNIIDIKPEVKARQRFTSWRFTQQEEPAEVE